MSRTPQTLISTYRPAKAALSEGKNLQKDKPDFNQKQAGSPFSSNVTMGINPKYMEEGAETSRSLF